VRGADTSRAAVGYYLSSRNVGNAGAVTEIAAYLPTAALLRQIANADTATLRLQGSTGNCEIPLPRQSRVVLGMYADSLMRR
jgi:hypothetical protein